MLVTLLILLAIPALVLIQGFFSGSEIALVNSDKGWLRHKAKEGHSGSALALKMMERPEVLLTTTLVGTNLALVLATVLGTMLLVSLFGKAGGILAIVILTPLTLVFGEVVPKSIFQQKSNKLTPQIVYPLYVMSLVFFPVVFVFSRVARLVARLVGRGRPGAEIFAVREQLRAVLETATGATPEHPFDRVRIRNVVRLGELVAGDLMTPAKEMIAIDSTASMADAIDIVRSTGRSHVPAYEGKRSNIVGMMSLTAWDLVEPGLSDASVSYLIKPAYFVPVQQPVAELLPVLRSRQDQSAVVVDEFGSAVGVVSVDTILESIVGNTEAGTTFEDRKNAIRPGYEELGDDVYLLDARMPISDVNELLATTITTVAAHTIGGLVVARLRHVPKTGEAITESGYEFVVAEATERAITRLQVSRSG